VREKPDLSDGTLLEHLNQEYAQDFTALEFLPLGFDPSSANYQAKTGTGERVFVKVRLGSVREGPLALARHLQALQVETLIPALATRSGSPWASTPEWSLAVFPYVEGHDAYDGGLTDEHLRVLGYALRQIHDAQPSNGLSRLLPSETYSPELRKSAREHVELRETPHDWLCERLETLLDARGDLILELVDRAEFLAHAVQSDPPPSTLCHADLHAGNLLITDDGRLHIVDWDSAILAPRERDLMFVGSGFLGRAHNPQQEEALFYDGYGDVPVNPAALAYYRYDRLIEDVALFCKQIRGTTRSDVNRELAMTCLEGSFLPDSCVDIAIAADDEWSPHNATDEKGHD